MKRLCIDEQREEEGIDGSGSILSISVCSIKMIVEMSW